jgi:hypothetical protein
MTTRAQFSVAPTSSTARNTKAISLSVSIWAGASVLVTIDRSSGVSGLPVKR